jgi:spore germination protein
MKRLTATQILILIPVLLFSGCWDQRVIEETGILFQVGIEPASGDKILVTSVFPAFDSRLPNQDEVITTEVNLLQEAIEEAKTITDKRVEGGKVQQILFAKEIAGQGIQELLEFFKRDPLISPLAQVVIVDGSPKELLEKARTFASKARTVFYINRLLAKNVNYLHVPETSIYDFSIYSLAPGLDPITPLLKLEPDGIRVLGSALFSAGRMVGQLDTQQTALLLAMMGRAPKTEFVFIASGLERDSPLKRGAAFTIRESHRKIRLDLQGRRLAIDILLDLRGVLDEYDQDMLDQAGPQEVLEERLSREVQENCLGILGYTQRLGSDPIGFGDLVRAKYYSAWKTMDWEEVYRDATVNVEVKMEIRQFGLIK